MKPINSTTWKEFTDRNSQNAAFAKNLYPYLTPQVSGSADLTVGCGNIGFNYVSHEMSEHGQLIVTVQPMVLGLGCLIHTIADSGMNIVYPCCAINPLICQVYTSHPWFEYMLECFDIDDYDLVFIKIKVTGYSILGMPDQFPKNTIVPNDVAKVLVKAFKIKTI